MTCTETSGCTGTFDVQGYCDRCGAIGPAGVTASGYPGAPDSTTATEVGATPATGRSGVSRRFGSGLVALPPVPASDPASAVLVDPTLVEDQRFCADPTCGAPVGRGVGDDPGRAEGFCPRCRRPFSFRPPLQGGDLVGGQYEIVGALAHGGLGWIYLARDRNVEDVWRVLKGVIHDGDPEAVANAIDERRFLASVNHPNIVKIINFVEHDGAGYIVMEYVDGISLRQVAREHSSADGGGRRPLPLTHAISYVLEILPALGHLHDNRVLYCDFKPENVMRTASSVKLIDLGGVYRMDDRTSPVYGTVGYAAPEIAETGPTVASDLFTVGRTLAVLCSRFSGFQTTYRYTLPPAEHAPDLARQDGLHRLLVRATATDPDDRFQSAEELADQLRGILRELIAAETGQPVPGPSAYFTGKIAARVDRPDWHSLPVPLVSPDDPAAAFLATIGTHAYGPQIDALRGAPEHTIELDLQLIRALLAAGRHDEVPAAIAQVRRAAPKDWRLDWYEGLHHLTRFAPEAAAIRFDTVYGHLPGELAPKLALAIALELSGEPGRAVEWYDCVSRTDPSFTAASFGLARCREALDDRAGADEAYRRVPDTSSHHTDAQIAAARLRLRPDASLTEIEEAARIIEVLELDPGRRAALNADVLELALPLVDRTHPLDPPARLLGCELHQAGIRRGLEHAYRTLARYVPTARERIELVDRANRVRTWSVT